MISSMRKVFLEHAVVTVYKFDEKSTASVAKVS